MPRYPIYIPSVGRAESAITPNRLLMDGVPFTLVVEPHEADAYREAFGKDRVLVMDRSGGGDATYARNFISDHARSQQSGRHWQLDDNIRAFRRVGPDEDGRKAFHKIGADEALSLAEDFTDRYANVGASSLRYTNWALKQTAPFKVNAGIASAMLIRNEPAFTWRGPTMQDVDYALQVLTSGDCTILFHALCIDKAASLSMGGGHTAHWNDDGKLRRVRTIQSRWPHLFSVTRREGQPAVSYNGLWSRFDTPLRPASR